MKIPFFTLERKNVGKKNPFLFSLGKDPYRDWKILMTFFIIFFVLIISFSVYIFLGVAKGELFQVPVDQAVKPKTFDQVFMKEVLSNFDNKQKKLEELKQKRIDIVDPAK